MRLVRHTVPANVRYAVPRHHGYEVDQGAPQCAAAPSRLRCRLDIHVVASGDEAANRRLSEDHGSPDAARS
jgi:hypothetical protein